MIGHWSFGGYRNPRASYRAGQVPTARREPMRYEEPTGENPNDRLIECTNDKLWIITRGDA